MRADHHARHAAAQEALASHLARAGAGPGKQADKLRGLRAPAATVFKSDNDIGVALANPRLAGKAQGRDEGRVNRELHAKYRRATVRRLDGGHTRTKGLLGAEDGGCSLRRGHSQVDAARSQRGTALAARRNSGSERTSMLGRALGTLLKLIKPFWLNNLAQEALA